MCGGLRETEISEHHYIKGGDKQLFVNILIIQQ